MNFVVNMMTFALKMMTFALKMMNFALKMMTFALKMMNFALKTMRNGCSRRSARITIAALLLLLAMRRCVFLITWPLFNHFFTKNSCILKDCG